MRGEYRDVYGTEAQEARAFATHKPTILVETPSGVTRFFRVWNTDEPRELLQVGWYQVCDAGIVLHWTHKSDVLTEIGALTVADAWLTNERNR